MAELREVTALPHPLAEIVKGALEAEGIPTELRREAISAVYGLDSGWFATGVLVPEEDVERARALIDRVEAGGS